MHISIDAPDIPDYPAGFLNFWAKQLFVGTVSSDFQTNALASTYVRLVEAALIEYQLGVSTLREFWETHTSFKITAVNRSISHFESCLSNMHRAINCYRRLRRRRDPLGVALHREKADFATDSVATAIGDMRNAIHHLEERVMDGRLKEGQPIALKSDGPEKPHATEPNQTMKSIDRLVIGQHELLFSRLAASLTEMGRVAAKIAEFNSPS